jgi:hypothetical protein
VPESHAGSAAFLFDLAVVGTLGLAYALTRRSEGCLSFLILAVVSIGVWGLYLTVAMRGGLKLSH